MKQKFDIKLKQKQKLSLNQNLQQMLQILQFSSAELYQFLEDETIENPVVQMDSELSFSSKKFQDNRANYGEDVDDDFSSISNEYTIYDTLRQEAMLLDFNDVEKDIALYMIDNLDESGYYKHDLEKTASDCNTTHYTVKSILRKLQTLDPAGVFAMDLIDNLNIQIDRKNDASPYSKVIINEYLEELSRNDLKKIKAGLQIDASEVQKAVDEIRSLSPFPIIKDSTYPRYIEPDMLLKITEEGDFILSVNEMYNRQLYVNPNYYELIQNENTDEKTKEYLRQKINRINAINSSIKQRAKTLNLICTEIINKQRQFLYNGELYLSSMTMLEIAKELNLSESTISRAVRGKYIDTPRGIYPLKFFFQSSVNNIDGGKTSSITIKEIIKDVVEKENKKKPISDSKICEIISQMGIDISRRTVAKYRSELGIKSSSMRKSLT